MPAPVAGANSRPLRIRRAGCHDLSMRRLFVFDRAIGSWADFRSGLWVILLLLPFPARPEYPAVAALVELALMLQLEHAPQWRYLLHQPAGGDRARSRVDSAHFFLGAAGQTDPRAELVASIRALYGATNDPATSAAICQFPARWLFLQRALGLDSAATLPPCPAYRRWRAEVGAERVTLVFASAYLGNPSSMFGHTLLRLDGSAAHQSSPLLAYAVNFSAQAPAQPGIGFAWRGLTGGYPGRFGLYPYYAKVKEYARIENRDLWEYPLQLTAAELEMLLAHVWELRDVAFDYYFLDENCSLQLLALLQVARPEAVLTEAFSGWVLPVDTIRQLQAQPGLLGQRVYRPALQSELAQQLAALPAELQAHLHALLAEGVGPATLALPQRDQARLAEVMHGLAYYRLRQREAAGRDEAQAEMRALRAQLETALSWRSQLVVPADFPPLRAPAAPEQGHRSQRLSFGLRWGEAGGPAQLLGYRPALHDGSDPAAGYTPGSAIEFLHLRLSVRHERLRLDALELLEIVSRPPRSAFFQPWSWQLAMGYRRPAIDAPGQAYVDTGWGASWSTASGLSGFAQARASALADAHGRSALAAGIELGAHWSGPFRSGTQIQALWIEPVWDSGPSSAAAELTTGLSALRWIQHWPLGRDLGLRFEARRGFAPRQERLELGIAHYF